MPDVDPIPPGPRLIPYLCVRRADEALAFYAHAFGMREVERMAMDDGRIGHAELVLDGVRLFLSDEFPEMNIVGPQTRGGATTSQVLFVADVDATARSAVEAGATLLAEICDEFHGYRTARLRDPFGHRWMLQSRLEALSAEEIHRRFAQREG